MIIGKLVDNILFLFQFIRVQGSLMITHKIIIKRKGAMSKGFKFGQIVGIVIGVVAGSMLVSALLGPRRVREVPVMVV